MAIELLYCWNHFSLEVSLCGTISDIFICFVYNVLSFHIDTLATCGIKEVFPCCICLLVEEPHTTLTIICEHHVKFLLTHNSHRYSEHYTGQVVHTIVKTLPWCDTHADSYRLVLLLSLMFNLVSSHTFKSADLILMEPGVIQRACHFHSTVRNTGSNCQPMCQSAAAVCLAPETTSAGGAHREVLWMLCSWIVFERCYRRMSKKETQLNKNNCFFCTKSEAAYSTACTVFIFGHWCHVSWICGQSIPRSLGLCLI